MFARKRLNKTVIISGLDGDSNRKPFGQILDCIPICNSVVKLTAMDMVDKDGSEGIFSLRIDDNNKDQVKHYKDRDMELLDTRNILIPTTDENGNISWGEVSAVTRHDPGDQLYEIKGITCKSADSKMKRAQVISNLSKQIAQIKKDRDTSGSQNINFFKVLMDIHDKLKHEEDKKVVRDVVKQLREQLMAEGAK